MSFKKSKNVKFFRESLTALGITIFGSLITGSLWGSFYSSFLIIAGIVALVPVIGQNRGNISGIFTSRLGTGLHLGSIKPSFLKRSKELNNTILMNLSLTVTLPIFASFIVFIVHFFNGGNTSYFKFLFIALVAAVMSGFFQILLTLSISFFVFKKGLDPDVVVYPIISVIADIITSFAIFTALSIELTLWPAIANDIFESFGELFALFYFCLFVLITFSTPIRSRSNLDFELFNLLKESIPIIMISILIGSIVGIILDKGITHEGIVLILPIFMSYTGAVGSIIGSKFTTSYHLGSLSMRNGKLEMYVYLPIILLIVGSALSSILGIVAFSISQSLNFSLPNTVTMFSYILVCVLISIITTMFSIINALFLGNLTFRRGIDADNVIVPLSTTLGDLIAIITVLIVTNVIFY